MSINDLDDVKRLNNGLSETLQEFNVSDASDVSDDKIAFLHSIIGTKLIDPKMQVEVSVVQNIYSSIPDMETLDSLVMMQKLNKSILAFLGGVT